MRRLFRDRQSGPGSARPLAEADQLEPLGK
jgi:hypothetical protein